MITLKCLETADSMVLFKDVTVAGGAILDKVNAFVPRGSWTSIVGPNGAGKTSLLLTLLDMIPYQGEILLGQGGKLPKIGYVPQRFTFDRGMPLTVMEFMLMGRQRLPFWFGCGNGRARAREFLAAVQAGHLEKRNIGALSGGELQRVLLALALQEEPELLVLDEPTSGVDFKGEQVFCDLLDTLRREHGFTQIMVSHDLATVTHHATHAICLNKKVVAEGPPRQVLTSENLTALFGLHMGLVDARSMPGGCAGCSAFCCREDRHD